MGQQLPEDGETWQRIFPCLGLDTDRPILDELFAARQIGRASRDGSCCQRVFLVESLVRFDAFSDDASAQFPLAKLFLLSSMGFSFILTKDRPFFKTTQCLEHRH